MSSYLRQRLRGGIFVEEYNLWQHKSTTYYMWKSGGWMFSNKFNSSREKRLAIINLMYRDLESIGLDNKDFVKFIRGISDVYLN